MKQLHEIRKTLSSNDLGDTGSHQAGILIPKSLREFLFFPELQSEIFNPRAVIFCTDKSTGEQVRLNYIYYNGKDLGLSTRSEYRLTGLTQYLRQQLAKVGDELLIEKNELGEYAISVQYSGNSVMDQNILTSEVIKLSGNWTSIKRGKIL